MADRGRSSGVADEQEMYRLMERYGAYLVGMCTLLLKDAHLAQDVVQETFIRAWKKEKLHGETEKAWLARVAVNLCRDEQRSRWFRHVDRRIVPEMLNVRAEPLPEDHGVLDCVHRLPAREREVMVMHYWNDMSPEEIAGVLCIDRATVFRRLARGRKRLRIEMAGGEGE